MSGARETEWRAALKARGVDWVKAELMRRPGRPDDIVYDVVFKDPYPTREFCERWCVDEDNSVLHLSGRSLAIFGGIVLLIIFVARAYVSWPKAAPVPNQGSMASQPTRKVPVEDVGQSSLRSTAVGR
jgi:hypothetical protein